MTFINQHKKYIVNQANHPLYKDITTKLEHMMNNGYGSITINNTIAAFDHEVEIDNERIVFINVGSEK